MQKIVTIISKEWMEIFKNRIIVFTVLFLPMVMAIIPLVVLFNAGGSESAFAANQTTGQISTDMPSQMCSSNQTGGECFFVYLFKQFLSLFMIIPVVIPGAIAAYSIVGEKNNHSLEPLLATPITTIELLVGKCLSAVIPAVISTYGAFTLLLIGTSILGNYKILGVLFSEPSWLIAIFLIGPLLAILATTFAMMVSSRVNDPRAAEQISVVIIIPILAVFFGQLSGFFTINFRTISTTVAVLLIIDILMVYVSSRVFDRESILSRWR